MKMTATNGESRKSPKASIRRPLPFAPPPPSAPSSCLPTGTEDEELLLLLLRLGSFGGRESIIIHMMRCRVDNGNGDDDDKSLRMHRDQRGLMAYDTYTMSTNSLSPPSPEIQGSEKKVKSEKRVESVCFTLLIDHFFH
jgi:hypothetical protein